MQEIRLISRPEAKYNATTGGFDAGADPDGFMQLNLSQASETVQTPMAAPVDETSTIMKTLRAREVRNRIAMQQAVENDPDYQFFSAVAGACGFKSVNDISERVTVATRLAPGSATIKVPKAPPGGPPTTPGTPGTPTDVVVNNGVAEDAVGTRFRIISTVMDAVNGATTEIANATTLLTIPVWAKTSEVQEDRLARALKESKSSLHDYVSLIGAMYALNRARNPSVYIPRYSAEQSQQAKALLLNKFRTNARWASSSTEAKTRGGAIIMESATLNPVSTAHKIPQAHDLYMQYR